MRAEQHHVARRRSRWALLLIDLLQPFAGDEGRTLHERTLPLVPTLLHLRSGARRHAVPVIYVNDQHGRWDSSRETVLREARSRLSRQLLPGPRDLLVLKPARSAFFHTPLDGLLEAMGVQHVVLTGVATDVCLLASASDALLRKLRVHVPRDACATLSDRRQTRAIDLMEEAFGVDTRLSTQLPWARSSRKIPR